MKKLAPLFLFFLTISTLCFGSTFQSQVVDLTAEVTGQLSLSYQQAIPSPQRVYVNKNRVDAYTADGSFTRPYLTIQAAINKVIANGDNTTTYPYVIDIVGGGTYTENLTLNSTALQFLYIDGRGTATVTPASGSALDSSSNNENLYILTIMGVTFGKPVNLVGATTASSFFGGNGGFVNSNFLSSATLTVKNGGVFTCYQCNALAAITLENLITATFSGGDGVAPNVTTTVTTASGNNKPSGFTQTILLFEKAISGDVTCGTGSLCQWREGSRVGAPGGTTTCTGTCQCYNSFVRSNVGGAGSFADNDCAFGGTLTTTTRTSGGFKDVVRIGAAAAATNANLIFKDGHLKSTQTTAPVATVNANAGTSATCTLSNATDSAGTINLTTTATSPASGAQCSMAFNKTYNVAPICVLSSKNTDSALFAVSNGSYFTTSTSALVVNYANADIVGHTNNWAYHCVETQ
jgi:hypothetical protein